MSGESLFPELIFWNVDLSTHSHMTPKWKKKSYMCVCVKKVKHLY